MTTELATVASNAATCGRDLICLADAHPGLAGWVQAIGAVLAIIAAIILGYTTTKQTKSLAFHHQRIVLSELIELVSYVSNVMDEMQKEGSAGDLEGKLWRIKNRFHSYWIGLLETVEGSPKEVWTSTPIWLEVRRFVSEFRAFLAWLEAQHPNEPDYDTERGKEELFHYGLVLNGRWLTDLARRELKRLS